ncbi:MAG: hypothetical protein H0T76_04000 [Nannocystis sp.]|nr:hypothetical protein [Nannocystis sp.]MBA3545624.1 hypothetical protein [Nannocystis sp.]
MTVHLPRAASAVLVLACACADPGGGDEAGTDAITGSSGDSSGGSSSGSTGASSVPTTSGTDGGSMSGTTGDASTGSPTSSTTDTLPPDMGPPARLSRCGEEPPPDAVLAPEIPKYAGACPILETGYMEGQAPNIIEQKVGPLTFNRKFLVIAPDDMQPDERLPVMFMWHWLGGSSKDFYERADAQNAVNQKRFIAVIPDGRTPEEGVFFKWPFSITDIDESLTAELEFFDDMLSCVHEQFNVDKDCVSSVGVSAGALFTSQLAGRRGDRLASFMSMSGGTGGNVVKNWKAPEHKLPGMVLWGGPGDFCIAVDFEDTSKDLEMHMVAGGHFVLECIHNCNHSTPPFEVPEGMTAFAPLWDFLRDHPFWLKAGESPYITEGMPLSMPTWCAVGAGNAIPPPGVCDQNECS